MWVNERVCLKVCMCLIGFVRLIKTRLSLKRQNLLHCWLCLCLSVTSARRMPMSCVWPIDCLHFEKWQQTLFSSFYACNFCEISRDTLISSKYDLLIPIRLIRTFFFYWCSYFIFYIWFFFFFIFYILILCRILVPLPSMARRPMMTIDGFPDPRPRRLEPEIEKKLKEIVTRSGIITIDGIEYKTDIKDMDDLGELGNGTSGHVVKMRHTPTNKPIAVKVISFLAHTKCDVFISFSRCKNLWMFFPPL